jgi:hypothetical protein
MSFAHANLRAFLRIALPIAGRPVATEARSLSTSNLANRILYFVVCDYGPKVGRSYVDTDSDEAERETVIAALMGGEYTKPIKILAVDTETNALWDATGEIAEEIVERLRASERLRRNGARRLPHSRAALRAA